MQPLGRVEVSEKLVKPLLKPPEAEAKPLRWVVRSHDCKPEYHKQQRKHYRESQRTPCENAVCLSLGAAAFSAVAYSAVADLLDIQHNTRHYAVFQDFGGNSVFQQKQLRLGQSLRNYSVVVHITPEEAAEFFNQPLVMLHKPQRKPPWADYLAKA